MKNKLLFGLLLFNCLSSVTSAQMWNGQDTLYGNEWIDYNKTYFALKVTEDGIYRIDYQTLLTAGAPLNSIPGNQWSLFHNGAEVPVYVSTEGIFGAADYLEFEGRKNRGEIDQYLFDDPAVAQINPWYSMYNDTARYYLTWGVSASPKRVLTVNNDLNNLPPPTAFCWQTAEKMYTDGLFKKKISEEIQYSWFDGNGYSRAGSASSNPFNIALPHLQSGGPDAEVDLRFACNLGQHHQQFLINDSLFSADQFSAFRLVQRSYQVGTAFLGTNPAFRLYSPIDDRNGLVRVAVRYPRTFDFDNATFAGFELDPALDGQYLECSNFNISSGAPVLWNFSTHTRITTELNNNTLRVKIPGSSTGARVALVAPAAVKMVAALQEIHFSLPNVAAANYLIISNKSLYAPLDGQNQVEAYAQYRSSAAGGGYQVAVTEINDLYEQFAYGIRFHPIALRNFLHWAKKQSPAIDHALIIGKALESHLFRSPTQQQTLADSLFFVPTISLPGADLPFVLKGNKLGDPIMAIGRLAVTKPVQIRDYLEKVILHEQQLSLAAQQIADKAWMKRVIHNSGGLSGEAGIIKSFTSSMAATLANNRFGADVRSFYKTSDDPVQLSAYEQLLQLMNEGVSVWSIFGHSSAFTVDFDIGQPDAYANYGHYPLMLIMGCFSGQCALAQPGIGEQFVLAPDKGAIAYIASVNYSYIDALYTYGNHYYERIGGDDYGKSVGLTLAHTLGDLKNTGNPGLIAVLHQNLLQGDPAVRVHTHNGPDYLVDNQSVNFNPNPFGLEAQNVRLKFDAVNIGENTGGKMALQIKQQLPDQTLLTRLTDTIAAPANRSTLEYQLPTSGSQVGFNRFFIELDPANSVPENPATAELNNNLLDAGGQPGVNVFVYANDIAPVYPLDFSIVNQQDVVLHASTLNASAPLAAYRFEIDSLETFNSPMLQQSSLTQRGGLLSWKPGITLRDSVVYYWRVARDTLIDGQLLWRQRSFIYLPGSSTGWNQSHYGQFRVDSFLNLEAVDTMRRIQFTDNAAFISVQIAYRGVNRYPGLQNSLYENFLGDFGWSQQGVSRGVAMVVANPNTGRLLLNPLGGPYNYSPPAESRYFFWFDTRDSLQRKKAMDFITQEIPNGYYVGLLAFNTPTDMVGYGPQFWANDSISQGRNLFQLLEQQGAKHVRALAANTGVPPAYGLVFRKNDPAYPAADSIMASPDDVAEIRANFLAKWSEGRMSSPAIGPVRQWKTLQWDRGAFDDGSDQAVLQLLAVREGQSDTLLAQFTQPADSNLQWLDAQQFPLLRLRYEVVDTFARTATPPLKLRLLYDEIPEGAVHPAQQWVFQRDTLQQGEQLSATLAFANISQTGFDSIVVRYCIENQANNGTVTYKKYKPAAANETIPLQFSHSTLAWTGPQRCIIEVNPAGQQPEQFHYNNILVKDFYVGRDRLNPQLDVTFDGAHVIDGDLVSPRPLIIITLKDENKYLALVDSGLFSLKLVYPDGTQKQIGLQDPALQFWPADAGALPKKNLARLEWRPFFEQDGTYRLLVNGRDASGNESAALDWSITFKVINKASLSNLLNYPNPFSTSTCFVYTLTGSESPARFRMQIMTVSGKVVREIDGAAFGPLKPGTHQSDFCWDGKDEFGDQLANGVYLYRVIAQKQDGSSFDVFTQDAIDGFFQHGFGKMVLMR